MGPEECAAVTYPSAIDPRSEVELLKRSLSGSDFSAELGNLRKYLFQRESSWVLDSSIVHLTHNVLTGQAVEDKVRLFRLFAHCSLRRDFSALFSSDRRDMCIMKYVGRFADLQVEEQKAVALFLCHASSQDEGRNYLLYLSRWTNDESKEVCNADISSRAAGCALKSLNPTLRNYGVAITFNLSLKKTFGHLRREDVDVLQAYVELAKFLAEAIAEYVTANEISLTDSSRKMCRQALENLSSQ